MKRVNAPGGCLNAAVGLVVVMSLSVKVLVVAIGEPPLMTQPWSLKNL